MHERGRLTLARLSQLLLNQLPVRIYRVQRVSFLFLSTLLPLSRPLLVPSTHPPTLPPLLLPLILTLSSRARESSTGSRRIFARDHGQDCIEIPPEIHGAPWKYTASIPLLNNESFFFFSFLVHRPSQIEENFIRSFSQRRSRLNLLDFFFFFSTNNKFRMRFRISIEVILKSCISWITDELRIMSV